MSSNNFFMDIFNKLLKINDDNIMIVFDISGNIWFAFRDLLIALGYSNYKKVGNQIKINKNFIIKYKNIKGTPIGVLSQPNKKFINESGLYELLSISRKPLAKIFMNEYFTKIMPQIRETGKYIMDNTNKTKLDKLNTKLNSIQQNNKSLINNQRNVIYPEGKALYIIKKISHEKTYYKIGYTGNLNRRLKTYNTSFPYKILYNYYLMVNNDSTDRCIKNIMHNEKFIKNKEYYKSSLNKILRFIILCDKRIDKICCGYCLKCYSLDNISNHKCKYL
jgi:prophage antirepressor-like protein